MKYYAENILLSDGWATDKTLTIENGIITAITPGKSTSSKKISSPEEAIIKLSGTVIPGMVNCHSHAFQRAFAGFSEQSSAGQDSFWTWRKVMYKFLRQLDHNDAQIIASQLYIEMLKKGYTRVAEFHYLHHSIDGETYTKLDKNTKLTTMAQAIFTAAKHAGIGLTILPVLYQYAGFGQQKPNKNQKRFINSTTQFNQLVSNCFTLSKQYQNTNVGIAPHSLRAVDQESIKIAVQHIRALDENAPIHIHIAEQQQEVNDCLAHYKKTPVQWLLENIAVDKHWCLIHATHITEQEQQAIVASKAIVGICPTTEANLGDGIFPTAEFLELNGTFAIGSDSHISINPIEELRWLEYSQRLQKKQRTILATNEQTSVGQNLWQKAAAGGAQCTNTNTGSLAIGKQADLLVLDDQQTRLFANTNQHLLDSMIFASQQNVVKDVMVNGCWVVKNSKHAQEQNSAENFAKLLTRLSSE
jgi:formimidoylglutamate deiminase